MITSKLAPFGLCVHVDSLSAVLAQREYLLNQVIEHGIVLIRGLSALTEQELVEFAANGNVDRLVHWAFGPVMNLQVDQAARNYLFTPENVPFHWDGAFFEVPATLVFNCLQAPEPGTGGATLFTDTQRICEDKGDLIKHYWSEIEVTYKTDKLAHYGGEITQTLLEKHPVTGKPVIRYGEPVSTENNPVSVDVLPKQHEGDLIAEMANLLYQPEYCYRHFWQAGDLLLADNMRLLHGRDAFQSGTPRHIRRVQIKSHVA